MAGTSAALILRCCSRQASSYWACISGFADTYGATGSLVIILLWGYYSAQVLFLGAEFTRAYAGRLGSISAVKNHLLGL